MPAAAAGAQWLLMQRSLTGLTAASRLQAHPGRHLAAGEAVERTEPAARSGLRAQVRLRVRVLGSALIRFFERGGYRSGLLGAPVRGKRPVSTRARAMPRPRARSRLPKAALRPLRDMGSLTSLGSVPKCPTFGTGDRLTAPTFALGTPPRASSHEAANPLAANPNAHHHVCSILHHSSSSPLLLSPAAAPADAATWNACRLVGGTCAAHKQRMTSSDPYGDSAQAHAHRNGSLLRSAPPPGRPEASRS